MTADTFDPYLHWLGIPPYERPVDHYRLLGVTQFESDARRIEEAADARMNLVRSYQSGPRVAHTQKLLNELSAARLCLTNPQSKASYDAVLRGRQVLGVASHSPMPPLGGAMTPVASAPIVPTLPMGMPPQAPPMAAMAPRAPLAMPATPHGYAAPLAIPLATPISAPGAAPYPTAIPYAMPPQPQSQPQSQPPLPPPISAPPMSSVTNSSVRERVPEPLAPPISKGHAEAQGVDSVEPGKQRRIAVVVAVGLVLVIGVGLGIARFVGRGGVEAGGEASDPADAPAPTEVVVGKREDSGNPRNARTTIDDPFGAVEVVQEGTGEMHFPAQIAELAGDGLSLELRGDDQVVSGWGGANAQSLNWNFRLVKPDIFRVELTYAASDDARGGRIVLAVDDGEPKAADIVATGGLESFRTDIVHLTVPRSGKHRLSLSVEGLEQPGGLIIKALRFAPKGIGDKKKS